MLAAGLLPAASLSGQGKTGITTMKNPGKTTIEYRDFVQRTLRDLLAAGNEESPSYGAWLQELADVNSRIAEQKRHTYEPQTDD